jgi:transposase
MSEFVGVILDIALGAAAFRLAWSVDKSQRALVKVQNQQAEILRELVTRVEHLENK